MASKGRLRHAIARWASTEDQDQRDLRVTHTDSAAVPIADAPHREQVRVRGMLRTVTLRPRGGVPALEADLDDGTAVVTLVWLGRRRIAGIEPGRSLTVRGCIGEQGGSPIMYNPRYELLP